jgi:hypothetical protein
MSEVGGHISREEAMQELMKACYNYNLQDLEYLDNRLAYISWQQNTEKIFTWCNLKKKKQK